MHTGTHEVETLLDLRPSRYDKTYKLSGDTKKFDAFAGQHVKITGEVTGPKVAVQTIAPAKQ